MTFPAEVWAQIFRKIVYDSDLIDGYNALAQVSKLINSIAQTQQDIYNIRINIKYGYYPDKIWVQVFIELLVPDTFKNFVLLARTNKRLRIISATNPKDVNTHQLNIAVLNFKILDRHFPGNFIGFQLKN
jgi:hypothetical protein